MTAEFQACLNSRPIVILANPYSGTGPTTDRVRQLLDILQARGCQTEIIWEKSQQQLFLGNVLRPEQVTCVIAVGGDGTVGDVINNLAPDIPLATLPCGNENLFAQEFGFSADPACLVEGILAGRTRKCDLIDTGQRKFALMLGAGFDADVIHRVATWRRDRNKLKRIRRFSYLNPIWQSLRQYDFPRLHLEVDGQEFTGHHLFVFNVSRYALGLPLAQVAEPDNGLMEWVLFQKPGLATMLSYFVDILRKVHQQRPDVAHGVARSLRIHSERPIPIQIDGDPFRTTPVSLQILPGRLTVVDMRR